MKLSSALIAAGAAILLILATERAGQPLAQDAVATPPLEQWLGEWRGTGTTNDAPARLNLKWERALGARFVRLTLVNEIGAEAASQRFEGLALYWPGASAGRFNGRWFDSEGATHLLDAVLDPQALIAEWGDGTTPRGRSSYRLLSPNAMEVIDEIRRKDGTWREFGRFRLERAPSA